MRASSKLALGLGGLIIVGTIYLTRNPATGESIPALPDTKIPLDASDHSTAKADTPIKSRQYKLTEEMAQLAIGLGGLFNTEELTFRSAGLEDQMREALSDYDKDWVLSLAKLERALLQLDKTNAAAAMAALSKTLPPDDVSNAKAYRIFFRAWAGVDAPTALGSAVSALPGNEVRLHAGEEVLARWGAQDAAAAAEAAAGLPETYGKDYLIYTVPYTYVKQDPIKAMGWADELPENYSRGTLQHCMLQWLEQDERAAANYAITSATQGVINSRNDIIITEVADTLVARSIGEAMVWLERVPKAGGAYYKGLETILEHWSESDPQKADEWLRKAPSSPQMDPVIDRYAKTLAHEDPERALEWTKSIQTPGVRILTIRSVLSTWGQVSPANARKWAMDHGYGLLPPG